VVRWGGRRSGSGREADARRSTGWGKNNDPSLKFWSTEDEKDEKNRHFIFHIGLGNVVKAW